MSGIEGPVWVPSAESVTASTMRRFARLIAERHGVAGADYAALHRWSVEQPELFWRELWDFAEIVGEPGDIVLENGDSLLDARWFPQARLNFAENLLRRRDGTDALVFRGEDHVIRRMSFGELRTEVMRCAAALRAAGVGEGDRVAAWMPNMPETVQMMLAAASIGAVFTSVSPEFGVAGVLDRFSQVGPKVLLVSDGYRYDGEKVETLSKVAGMVAGLPTVECVVVVPYSGRAEEPEGIVGAVSWRAFLAPHRRQRELEFAQLPFDHPLMILYSSGTTGAPKCIVHGAGGTLLQHLKEHRLHCGLRAGDRLFFATSCGWSMWNWTVSALASGATLMLYDGSPMLDDGGELFDYAEAEGATHFGASARYFEAFERVGLSPRSHYRLDRLRMVLSTGSPLWPESYDYVYREIKADVCLASISGGTDIASCFVLGNPALPVWRGEIQCAGLGMAVEVFDAQGCPVSEEKGELVGTRAFPSMPIALWGDADRSRYRETWLERFPGAWWHGDFCERTRHGGFIIHGRSDATLNPGGVRIGSAEIYRPVEAIDEVAEAVAIAQDWPSEEPTDIRIVLFVRLLEGLRLDEALMARIRAVVRESTSSSHVPERIVQVDDIPRTRSGLPVELAVRRVVHGEEVENLEAIVNPEALEHFRDRAELKH